MEVFLLALLWFFIRPLDVLERAAVPLGADFLEFVVREAAPDFFELVFEEELPLFFRGFAATSKFVSSRLLFSALPMNPKHSMYPL